MTGAAAWALPLLLYACTVAPTVYGVDSADLTTAAYLLGIAHPPGSPTYLLVAHMFTSLPLGDVGYRVNLLSAVSGALASFFVYRIVVRLGGEPWLGVATAWLVATSYYVWTAAIAAELYAPQGCVVAGLIALALRWRATLRPHLFYTLCLFAGLGLGVHLSLILMLPGLALLALAPPLPVRPTLGLFAVGALCGVLGASVYLYLPLRYLSDLALNPARDYWGVDLASWSGWWWMVSGAGFSGKLGAATDQSVATEIATFAHRIWSTFLGLPALLGCIGLAVELRRQPGIHLALLLMVLGHLGFYLTYEALDKETMFVPVYLVWGVWIGFGVRALAEWFANALFGADVPPLAPAVLGCVVALLLLVNYRFADASADYSARQHGEAVLAALEPRAVFVGSWADLRLVEYLQYVEGRRRDVTPVDAFFVSNQERARRLADALQSNRPVYVTACRDLPDPAIQCAPVPACGCYRLHGHGTAATPGTTTTDD